MRVPICGLAALPNANPTQVRQLGQTNRDQRRRQRRSVAFGRAQTDPVAFSRLHPLPVGLVSQCWA
jgi:hypothetical protein